MLANDTEQAFFGLKRRMSGRNGSAVQTNDGCSGLALVNVSNAGSVDVIDHNDAPVGQISPDTFKART